LPRGCQANIRRESWRIPPIFEIIQRGGSISPAEMYKVFNMGIGMVLIVPKKRETEAVRQTRGRVIGEIVEGSQTVVLV
jgi:phosphoribosylformylglycinamidine cyclo-ligase